MVPRFQGGKREELIGITYNRLIRMDASTGDAIKTWRFSNMKQWHVNWEIKMVGGSHGEEEDCGCTDRQTDRQTDRHRHITLLRLSTWDRKKDAVFLQIYVQYITGNQLTTQNKY